KGNIVGFSDRINSILIPKSLMDWANKKFGSTTESSISRLILATDNPYSLALQQFLKANNYEVSTGKLIGGQLGLVLNIILGILAFIGLVITLLSILVFTLNFELIISRSSQDIDLLLQLGYRPKQISDLLVKQLALLFGAVLVLALVTLIVAHFGLSKWLASQSFPLEGMVHWSVILVALLLGIFFLFGNKLLIEKRVRGLFR
ncbi:MAG: FtsX-like permease family protein, partial [Bacteroidota bacterium]